MMIRLLDLGTVPYLRSQTIFHGVAYAMGEDSPDTITLMSPREPYVCIGFHQELEKEIDVDYCGEQDIPTMRREIGGGAVYLDDGQVFYHWIFHPERLPRQVEEVFRLYCQSLVQTYRAIGIDAEHRPVNDILVRGRKIGGTGAASIGEATVLAGSLMFDFNFELMARVLKVPSEKFRDKVYQSLQEYMTTIKRELGKDVDRQAVKDMLIQQCRQTLGVEIEPGELTDGERRMVEELGERFGSSEWLHQKGGLRQEGVKIREGVRVVEADHKAKGGLIRVTARVHEGHIDDLSLSGDFFFHPSHLLTSLEQALRGERLEETTLSRKIANFYAGFGIQSPGVGVEDWVTALMLAGGQAAT
ncbi:MAG: lipoate--protein ligase family protein [Chloroflexi bacterium]|nr:lipoate--protein ligase family protein [Chloroflexota bacterium]